MLSLSPACFPLLIISWELPPAAPPAPRLTFPRREQSPNVRRFSVMQNMKRPLQLTPISQTDRKKKKIENLVRKAAEEREENTALELSSSSLAQNCWCITEAQLTPSVCCVPTHLLPHFMGMVELFNLHIDWQRQILAA